MNAWNRCFAPICTSAVLSAGLLLACTACQTQNAKPTAAADTKAKPTSTSEWRDTFTVAKANWTSTGRNPYFILEPGHRQTYKHGQTTLTISVLNETRVVDGVETRIVEEREEKNGQPAEISRNFFAIDRSTSDVYYFGEEVDIYKNGKVVEHEGAWLSGKDGARFGLMMPGQVKVGDKFYQEIAPGEAMDRAEIVSTDERLGTPAGTFEHCVHVVESSPLEKGVSHKWYAPGVGLIKDDRSVLQKPENPPK
jgi:hypothetical protein